MRHRPWLWFLLVGATLAAVEGVLGDSIAADVAYLIVCGLGIAAILAGVRIHRPRRVAPWVLLAAGALTWLVGDVLWVVLDRPGMSVVAVAPADLVYLIGYLVLAAALLRLAGRPDVTAALDALILGVAVAAILWTVVVRPAPADVDLGARVVGLAYPVLAAVLVAYLAHLVFAGLHRTASLHLLGLGFTVVLLGDVAHQVMQINAGSGVSERLVESAWTIGYVLWGTAALHPSMRNLDRAPGARPERLSPSRVMFLTLAGMTLPGIVFVEVALGVQGRSVAIAVFGVLLVGLVGARFWLLVRHLRQQTEGLAHAADHDFLTGLLTRRAMRDRLAAAAAEVRAGGAARPAVIMIGLERFQEFSTTLGHRVGDDLLRAVGERLVAAAPCPTLAHARMGGDVFAVLVPDAQDTDELLAHARSIAAAVREPFAVSDLEVAVDAGVGVVRAPDHGTDPAQLFHRADVALMAARTMKGRVTVWHPLLEAGGALAPELMAELRDAVDDGQIVVHFQPQLDVRTGRVVSVEALVRWAHPLHGLLGPVSFIPAAERTGQIRAITRCVLDQALTLVAASRAAGRELAVSVNLSVRDLLDPRLLEDVRDALDRHDVDPNLLELEITETSAMVEPDRSAAALLGLVELGATVSIDDYGTGYGSLAYLQNLPIGRLKIDRSFVGRINHDLPSAAIVRSVVELSTRLGLTCVAEGVEDDETLLALQQMGCEMAQGFGLARPVPAERLVETVNQLEKRMATVLHERATVS